MKTITDIKEAFAKELAAPRVRRTRRGNAMIDITPDNKPDGAGSVTVPSDLWKKIVDALGSRDAKKCGKAYSLIVNNPDLD
jgi:hypothetical protein